MKFQVGVGLQGFKITVRPAETVRVEAVGGVQIDRVPALRADFKWQNGFMFDSELAQQENGWSDEERKLVEKYLLDPRKNRYLNRSELRKTMYCVDIVDEHNRRLREQSQAVGQGEPAEPKPMCKGWDVDAGAPCTEDAIEGIDYCKRHVPIRESV